MAPQACTQRCCVCLHMKRVMHEKHCSCLTQIQLLELPDLHEKRGISVAAHEEGLCSQVLGPCVHTKTVIQVIGKANLS